MARKKKQEPETEKNPAGIEASGLETAQETVSTPETEKPAEANVGTFGALATRYACLLDEPTEAGHPVSVVNAGTYLRIVGTVESWTMVLFGNVRGWVPSDVIGR